MSKALKGLLKTPCSLALIQCLHLHYRCIVAIVQVFALVLLQNLACRPPTLLWTSLKNLSIPVTTSHHLQTGNRIFNCHWPDYLAKKSISLSITPTLCQSLTQGQYMKCGKNHPKQCQWLLCVTDVYNSNASFSSPDIPITWQNCPDNEIFHKLRMSYHVIFEETTLQCQPARTQRPSISTPINFSRNLEK